MKFSIITPLYNKAEYFGETAASVLGQTWEDWEWIIVDDGSTDESFSIAQQTLSSEPRAVLLRQANSGPCTARNAGVAAARGEWLLFLDADDHLETDCLERFAAVCRGGEAGIHVGGWRESMDGKGPVLWGIGHGLKDPNELLRQSAIAHAPWIVTAAVVQRELVHGPCLWETAMDRLLTEDTVFWWRLIARYRAACHPICGVRYRRGTASARDRFNDAERWAAGLFYALKNNVEHWEGLGFALERQQILSLVRVYSAFGTHTVGHEALSAEAFGQADKLLNRAGWGQPALAARRLLGCRHFERLRRFLKKLTP